MPSFTKACCIVAALAWAWPTLATECDSDALLQQQVSEFNKLAGRCEAAARQEDNYVMRLWHWKSVYVGY
jgi:hypothetical protein